MFGYEAIPVRADASSPKKLSWMSAAVTWPSLLADTSKICGSRVWALNLIFLRFKTMSVTSSTTSGRVVNSCRALSILMAVIAAPCSDDSRMRRNELPMVMPNPRSNTVVDPNDVAKAVNDARQGRVEFRLDRTALIHVPIGKVSFDEDKLLENMATVVDAIVKAKPSGAKGQYIRAASIATTMGPGIRLELAPTLALTAT